MLTKEKSSKVLELSKQVILVYGRAKIGKSTLASMFPGAWFFATEPGQDWLTVREPTVVNSWENWLSHCAWIEQNRPATFADGSPISTLVIDTYDLLFKMCMDHVCNAMGVGDPGEIPHGGGWARLTKEIERVMSKIARWPYGIILISHARQREFKTRGLKTDRYEPDVGAAGTRWANAAADIILHASIQEYAVLNDKNEPTGEIREQRILQCHPSAAAVAGGRMSHLLPVTIPLDYATLMQYFEGTSQKEANPS